MTKINKNFTDLMKIHEGEKLHLYEDTKGVQTIGVGYNIQEHGLPQYVVDQLLEKSLLIAELECWKMIGSDMNKLNEVRQHVLINMMFNLGRTRLSKFKKMRKAIKSKLPHEAAKEMKDSKWYREDVAKWRAEHLISMMITGEWEEYSPF